MTRKKSLILAILLLLAFVLYRFAYYNLPLQPVMLNELDENCHVKVLPVYKGLEQDDKLKILNEEDILELKEFLQNSTFSRLSPRDGINKGSDTTYHITVTWSDGRYLQIRTFGENIYGSDILAWDTGSELLLLQAHDEGWYKMLAEQIADWS